MNRWFLIYCLFALNSLAGEDDDICHTVLAEMAQEAHEADRDQDNLSWDDRFILCLWGVGLVAIPFGRIWAILTYSQPELPCRYGDSSIFDGKRVIIDHGGWAYAKCETAYSPWDPFTITSCLFFGAKCLIKAFDGR